MTNSKSSRASRQRRLSIKRRASSRCFNSCPSRSSPRTMYSFQLLSQSFVPTDNVLVAAAVTSGVLRGLPVCLITRRSLPGPPFLAACWHRRLTRQYGVIFAQKVHDNPQHERSNQALPNILVGREEERRGATPHRTQDTSQLDVGAL